MMVIPSTCSRHNSVGFQVCIVILSPTNRLFSEPPTQTTGEDYARNAETRELSWLKQHHIIQLIVSSVVDGKWPSNIVLGFILVICPIAIAYSMGQITKSVCACVLCTCVCVCICPSASTLTVAFLDRFSPKLAQT